MNLETLLFDLYNAESAEAVHQVIKKYGLCDESNWKPYGGNANNAGTFENQQSTPEGALVEKITNSIDAKLTLECLKRGINPKDDSNQERPLTMADAVQKFFGVRNGRLENITPEERNRLAQGIQIIVSDDQKTPNITIYDDGEGQNPSQFEDTFLSIAHGNKTNIPFVQGKFNMGATGAVVFCGDSFRYQMIISRRNTSLKDADGKIGFTLVRRHVFENREEEKNIKCNWYEYLAIDGAIPTINNKTLNLGLNNRLFESGSVVKMYSYQLTKYSDATLDLWRSLNPLMYDSALPILIYEKRYHKGHSYTKPMLGNRTRIAIGEENDKKHVTYRKSFFLQIFDVKVPIEVYVFDKETKNTEFIQGMSVIFTLNGQTQGIEKKTFISQELGFRNLKEYMLVCVDCTQIGISERQELFMASRDRLKQGKYYNELIGELIDLLKNDTDIKQWDQDYKGKTFKENAEDGDLVHSVFEKLLNNEDIRKMFSNNNGAYPLFKKKIPDKSVTEKTKTEKQEKKKELRRYPSFFKVHGFEKGDAKDNIKAIRIGKKGYIKIETDACNDFLTRSEDPGCFEITTLDYENKGNGGDYFSYPSELDKTLKVKVSGPYDGEINISIEPKEDAVVGSSIPLSLKMISSEGEFQVVVYVKIEEPEKEHSQQDLKKQKEEITPNLPKLTRVYKESVDPNGATWKDCGMDANSIVKCESEQGCITDILINMDSNLVKKIINKQSVSIERVRDKYVTAIYSHALMLYTTMYGYYDSNVDIDNNIKNNIKDSLEQAVESIFKYYGSFIMSFNEDYSE